jgi:hypothetical protein
MSQNNASECYFTEIVIPWGNLGEIADWCNLNLQSNWTVDIISPAGENSGVYRFKFESLQDHTSFSIWMKLTCMT